MPSMPVLRTSALALRVVGLLVAVLIVLALWLAVTWGRGASPTPMHHTNSGHIGVAGAILPDPVEHIGGS
jgi:hypothetical protein